MRRSLLALLAVTVSVTALTAAAPAPGQAAGSPWPVLAKTGTWTTPAYSAWYSRSITSEHFSSPVVGDLGGRGRPSVVAGFPDGTVQAFDAVTGQRWYSMRTGAGAVQGSPSLVDWDRDGKLDVVAANTAGDVVVYNGKVQQLFRVKAGDGRHQPGVFASPTVVDLDKNGTLDIVVPSWDHNIHVWTRGGKELPGFPVFVKDTIWSSAAVGDLDLDGKLEIVFGYDCDGVPGQDCYPKRGGYLMALHHNGSRVAGWPRFLEGQVIWSSPAIAQLDDDRYPEVVVGTGLMPTSRMPGGKKVFAFQHNGRTLPGWPVTVGGRVMSSPAIGDVNGDGKMDVATVADDGYLRVHSRDGSLQFAKCLANSPTGCPKSLHSSAVMADINGDGLQDVVVGGEQWVNVYGRSGTLLARGVTVSGTYPVTAAPVVATVGGQTRIYAAASGKIGSAVNGRIFVWDALADGGAASWPAFHRNGAPLAVPGGRLRTTAHDGALFAY